MSRYHPRPEPWTRLAIPVVRAVTAVTSRPDYRGRANLPRRGGVVLAANHLANVDPVLLARFVLEQGRIPRFLAKHPLFEMPVLGRLLYGAGQIPVYRGRANAADALEDAVAALRHGEVVVIYPEGTFTTDPERWPMTARNGVARLALLAGVPVVPVAQWGASKLVGPRGRLHVRRRYSVLVGEPLDPAAWSGAPGVSAGAAGRDPATLHRLTTEVMTRVRAQLSELRGSPAPDAVWDPKRGERVSAGFARRDEAAA